MTKFKKVSITSINPDPANPRKALQAEDQEYQNIKGSIQGLGFLDPIIIDTETREIIGGHQRHTVLQDSGVTELYEIPLGGITWLTPEVDLRKLNKTERIAANIALNKIAGEWEPEKLVAALESIKVGGLEIEITGFGEKELVSFIAEINKDKEPLDTEPQISRAEELRKEWGTEIVLIVQWHKVA